MRAGHLSFRTSRMATYGTCRMASAVTQPHCRRTLHTVTSSCLHHAPLSPPEATGSELGVLLSGAKTSPPPDKRLVATTHDYSRHVTASQAPRFASRTSQAVITLLWAHQAALKPLDSAATGGQGASGGLAEWATQLLAHHWPCAAPRHPAAHSSPCP